MTAFRFRPAIRELEIRCVPATLVVNSTADDTAADNVLTLREALYLIRNGGATTGLGHSLSAGESAQVNPDGIGKFGLIDTITFDPALAGQTITLTRNDPGNGDPTTPAPGQTGLLVTRSVTIDGSSAPGLTISGGGERRIFAVVRDTSTVGQTLAIQNLTLADGFATTSLTSTPPSAYGGAVANDGAVLIVDNVTFRDNCAVSATGQAQGGAVFSAGDGSSLSMSNSTVTRNSAVGLNKTVNLGGGIAVIRGSTTLTNLTVTGNSCPGGGSDLFALEVGETSASVTVSNCLFGDAGGTSLSRVIFAVNNSTARVSGSNNLICGQDSRSLPAGMFTEIPDPLLSPLGFRGGPTPTMLPLGGSPLINAGTNSAVVVGFDQRGQGRIAGGTADVGAVELQAAGFATGAGAGGAPQVTF